MQVGRGKGWGWQGWRGGGWRGRGARKPLPPEGHLSHSHRPKITFSQGLGTRNADNFLLNTQTSAYMDVPTGTFTQLLWPPTHSEQRAHCTAKQPPHASAKHNEVRQTGSAYGSEPKLHFYGLAPYICMCHVVICEMVMSPPVPVTPNSTPPRRSEQHLAGAYVPQDATKNSATVILYDAQDLLTTQKEVHTNDRSTGHRL